MAFEHEHHGAEHEAHGHHGPKVLPSVLVAPDVVKSWQMRALIVAVIFALLSAALAAVPGGVTHLERAYLAGFMLCFNLCGGALAFLMVQYVSGGKWGLILRRPLEAMTRTIWYVIGLAVVLIVFFMKHLYLWAMYTTKAATLDAYHKGLISNEEHLDIDFRHVMLNPGAAIFQAAVVLGFMALLIVLLNKWSVQRDADTAAGTVGSFDKWRVRFENVSGPSILLYVILMTDFVIVFVKSLDIIWASSEIGRAHV